MDSGRQLKKDELFQRWQSMPSIKNQLTVVAVNIKKVGNVGSIFRNCDAAGIDHIIFVDTFEFSSKKINPISVGLHNKISHEFITGDEMHYRLDGFEDLVAIEITSNSKNLLLAQLPIDPTFVIGSEGGGIPQYILDKCKFAVHIPMMGVGYSMNVSTALGIVLFEHLRQTFNNA